MRHLVACCLAALVAVVVAVAVIGVWWMSPIPTFLLLTPLLHGLLLAVALCGLFDGMLVRSRAERLVIGTLAGMMSVAALVFWQYANDASAYRAQHERMTQMMAIERGAPAQTSASRFELYDRNLLVPRTGHAGVIGYLQLRYRPGTWRWYVYGVEAVLIVTLAAVLPVAISRRATVD